MRIKLFALYYGSSYLFPDRDYVCFVEYKWCDVMHMRQRYGIVLNVI